MQRPAHNLIREVKALLQQVRQEAVRQVNYTIVVTYFEIGKKIVEEEQEGKERATYGKQLLKELSKELINEFGKGFSVDNLENMRKFYIIYSNSETPSRKSKHLKKITPSLTFKLSWSHYLKLMRINSPEERQFYENEAYNNNWSVRELQRQFDSALYERLVLSKDKKGVRELNEKGQLLNNPEDAIKDPYVLEFLGLKEETRYSESELENAIIDKIEHFLLELGKGFTFVARQKRISLAGRHFYIDLAFYNRLLRCFVLIDLKIGDLTHQDIGQMQMYVNYYDRKVKLEGENYTIGIILCKDKNETLVKYTLPVDNEQIFASKFQTVLPSKEELKKLIEKRE